MDEEQVLAIVREILMRGADPPPRLAILVSQAQHDRLVDYSLGKTSWHTAGVEKKKLAEFMGVPVVVKEER